MPGAGIFIIAGLALLLFWLSTRSGEASVRVNFTAPKKSLPDIPFADLFDQISTRFDVPWKIMVAIVEKESGFNPSAVNEESAADTRRGRDVDSVGLAQILWPDTAKALDPNVTREDLFRPEVNLGLQGMLLRDLLSRYPETDEDGFPERAVSAYNAGVPKLDPTKFNNLPYVAKVKQFWLKYAN